MKSTLDTGSALVDQKKVESVIQTESHVNKTDQSAKESAEDSEKLQAIDRAIAQCRTLYQSPLVSDRTRRAYEEDWEQLRNQRKVEWMQDNVGFLLQMLQNAESYKDRFSTMLNDAVEKKWIGTESRSKWWNRFNDPNMLEWTRKEWIQHEFPTLLQNWQTLADKRKDVEQLAQKHNVTRRQIPELANILNQEAFLSLHYLSRKDQLAKVEALILAHAEGKDRFIKFVQKELEDWAKQGWLHPAKVGRWILRVMKSENPEEFVAKTLYPFKNSWKEVRENFDTLNNAFDKQGIPRGFRSVKEQDFLLMNYKQRTSYCALAWLRLEDVEETDKALASLKLRIRHHLDTHDWDGAEEDLAKARAIRGDDRELASMQTFLECHRADQEDQEQQETPDPRKTLERMRSIVSQIPGSLQYLYLKALEDGPAVFHRLTQMVGNGPWAANHGYTSEASKVKNHYDQHNQVQTLNYIEQGHSQALEHNVLDGNTATEEAIRDDCTKAQYLYMGKMGREAVLSKVRKNKDNEGFGYWSILMPDDISLAIQEHICKNFHHPLKQGLRELRAQNIAFTIEGEPAPLAA